QDFQFDAIVSPANSFGFMDGGADLYIEQAYPGSAANAQRAIREFHSGELPVGSAVIVQLGNTMKSLVVAPTMRVPRYVNPENAYLAMKAALQAVKTHNIVHEGSYDCISRLLCMGMGTGCGQIPVHRAARAMELAYRTVSEGLAQTWQRAKF